MSGNPVESFRTHSNYIRAFATLLGADGQCSPDEIYLRLARKVVQSGCLPKPTKTASGNNQILSSLKNAWGTEFLTNVGKHFVSEHDLVKVSNNWTTVQVYYVLYHSTQAIALAKGFVRPQSHPKTQHLFHSLWADRNLHLEPWTIAYGPNGPRNIPSPIVIDKAIHTWSHCSSISAWSLACKALETTREDKLNNSIKVSREKKRSEKIKRQKQQQLERIQHGKKPKKPPKVPLPRLTEEEKLDISQKEPPTTIIDYLYRLRIKTNYVDSDMFTDGPETEHTSLQVRDDLSIIAGGSLLLAELMVSNIGVPAKRYHGYIENRLKVG